MFHVKLNSLERVRRGKDILKITWSFLVAKDVDLAKEQRGMTNKDSCTRLQRSENKALLVVLAVQLPPTPSLVLQNK